MDYGHYYWGLYRDYYRDPFPYSLLSTRQSSMGTVRIQTRLPGYTTVGDINPALPRIRDVPQSRVIRVMQDLYHQPYDL